MVGQVAGDDVAEQERSSVTAIDVPTIDALLALLHEQQLEADRKFDHARGYRTGLLQVAHDDGRRDLNVDERALFRKANDEAKQYGSLAADLRTTWFMLTGLVNDLMRE
jgi:hypothetical protein